MACFDEMDGAGGARDERTVLCDWPSAELGMVLATGRC
jgi:hypothetical protein